MQILLALIVALAASLLGPKFLGPYLPASLQPQAATVPAAPAETAKETAFQRVMRTGVIKCGYYDSPAISKDLQTGQLEGPAAKIMEIIGSTLGLKVEWTAEVQPNEVAAALNANKFDLLCTPASLSKATRVLTHTKPIYYKPMWAFTRADDNRFDGDINKMNDATVTIAEQEDDVLINFDKMHGLKSEIYTVPQGTDPTAQLDAVVAKQADVAFVEIGYALKHAATNIKKIKLVPDVHPRGVIGEYFAMKSGENELKNALDEAIDKLNNSKEISTLLMINDAMFDGMLGAKAIELKKPDSKFIPAFIPAGIGYDSAWLKKEDGASKQPTAEDLKALGIAPAQEPTTAPQPDDAALEKPADATTPEADAAAPEAKTETKADKEVVEPKAAAESETKSDITPDAVSVAEKTAEPKTDDTAKADVTKSEKPVAKKAKPKASVAPATTEPKTLDDVKEGLRAAIEKAANQVAVIKAAEEAAKTVPITAPTTPTKATSLPPGVTVPAAAAAETTPQALTGRGIISPSLPETTISPSSAQ